MNDITRRSVLKTGTALALAPAFATLSSSLEAAPYDGEKLVEGEPPLPAKGSFTVAVLPDTQHYSQRFPETFAAQTKWLVQAAKARSISCVMHLGDITNRNTPAEWENAANALGVLDGKLPCFFVPGNHDYSEGGRATDRTTLLNDHLPVRKYRDLPTFGGTYDKERDRMENSYHLFSAGGRGFVVIGLEFGPRRDVLRWANQVAAKHKDREAIYITHAHIYYDETRYDWKKYGAKQKWNPHGYGVAKATDGDVNDGQQVWDGLLSKHENFILTLNGHVLSDGLGHVVSQTPGGRDVHQLLVNFQMKPNGGDGWLRLLEFKSDGKTVETHDYSPVLNKRNESPANRLTLKTRA